MGGGSDGDYWVAILKIIESTDLVKSKNKPHFVTAILAIYYGLMVYFFIGGVLNMRSGCFQGPFLSYF